MAKKRASSGAPGLTNAGPGAPALNPISLAAKAGRGGLHLDPTLAKAQHRSDLQLWFDDGRGPAAWLERGTMQREG